MVKYKTFYNDIKLKLLILYYLFLKKLADFPLLYHVTKLAPGPDNLCYIPIMIIMDQGWQI